MKEYLAVKKWDDDYDGSAIYSLIDEFGKRYIGQAIHLQQRLETHRRELNKASKGNNIHINEGEKLVDAVKAGRVFSVEILKKLEWSDSTVNNLRYWENYYLDQFGGIDNTYNNMPIASPVWDYDPFNDVSVLIQIKDSDVLNHLEQMENMQDYIKGLIKSDVSKKL